MKAQLIEATPDGINFMLRNESGNYQHQKLIGYKSAIKQLDRGDYDQDLPQGMRVAAAIWDAEALGYILITDQQQVIIWRWIVSALFLTEQRQLNGSVNVRQGDGTTEQAVKYYGEHGGIAIYPVTVRLSLANHIESVAIERFSQGNAHQKSALMYQHMTTEQHGRLTLSDWGNEALAMLHDGFIEQLNREGFPSAPVFH